MKEALKLALEALEAGDWYINQLEMIVYSVDDDGTHENRAKVQAAITAIKEALAQPDYRAVKTYHEGKPMYVSQPEQEPVAWEQFYPDIGKPQLGQEPVAIYRAGQAKGEGFHVEFLKEMGDDEVLLYTPQPQRPWVGLTNEEKQTIYQSMMWGPSIYGYADAIEATLKEKNT